MNKMDYLSKLNGCLSALPKSERDEAVRYYSSLFADAGSENEQSVISSLGSPQELAHTILNDKNGISYELGRTKKEVNAVRKKLTSKQTAAVIFLIVLASPFWISILSALAVVIAGLFAVSAVSVISLVIAGIALVCMGAAYLANTLSIALALSGTGIALASLGILIFTPVMNLAFFLVKLIIRNCIRLLNKILGKTEGRSR